MAIRWSREDLEAVAQLDTRTRSLAEELWRRHAPRGYKNNILRGTTAVPEQVLSRFHRGLSREMISLSEQLAAREITVAAWQRGMADLITAGHHATAAVSSGRMALLTADDLLVVRERLVSGLAGARGELQYLQELAAGLESGQIRRAGRFIRGRTPMYGRAVRGTYYGVQANKAQGEGHTHAERVLGATTGNCVDCLEYAAMGPRPIAEVPMPGERCQCMSNCRCSVRFLTPGEPQFQPFLTEEDVELLLTI